MFGKVLVANRGEIAIRAFRAAYELGAATVAVFAHEDRTSLHRLKADESYQIGEPGHPVRAYLSVDEMIAAARRSGADAIYPAYWFLSENPRLAYACRQAGIPSASLWAAVPHYVAATPSPKAALALVQRTSSLLSSPVLTTDLELAAADYERQVTEVVESDDDVAGYVRQLEERVDELDEAEVNLPSGDALAAELEKFLREHGGD